MATSPFFSSRIARPITGEGDSFPFHLPRVVTTPSPSTLPPTPSCPNPFSPHTLSTPPPLSLLSPPACYPFPLPSTLPLLTLSPPHLPSSLPLFSPPPPPHLSPHSYHFLLFTPPPPLFTPHPFNLHPRFTPSLPTFFLPSLYIPPLRFLVPHPPHKPSSTSSPRLPSTTESLFAISSPHPPPPCLSSPPPSYVSLSILLIGISPFSPTTPPSRPPPYLSPPFLTPPLPLPPYPPLPPASPSPTTLPNF